MFYLNDGTLGGLVQDIHADLHTVECEAWGVGLELNHSKCENISSDPVTFGEFQCTTPGHMVVNPEIANLLSSPIVSLEWFEGVNDIKLLELLRERLGHLLYHNPLCVLCNVFSRPNLYTFKASLYIYPKKLTEFHTIQCFNPRNSLVLQQVYLPVKCGGLGVWDAVMLTLSAFLALASGWFDLVSHTKLFLGLKHWLVWNSVVSN